MNLELRIKELVKALLEEKDGYLVDLKLYAQEVQVFIDRDPNITIADCAYVSRTLEKELNKEFAFSEEYALEVSSPGLDQPLKVIRQYKKSIGRKVDVILVSGEKKLGILIHADEEKIILEETNLSKIKNSKPQQIEIPFLSIKSTSLVITF
ncbi:MAG: ribosome assembly cofactor RimP [Chitinophagales bacterium]|nr:ribosome assembly cofactor RimP [Chitinophagales bacterium]